MNDATERSRLCKWKIKRLVRWVTAHALIFRLQMVIPDLLTEKGWGKNGVRKKELLFPGLTYLIRYHHFYPLVFQLTLGRLVKF